MKPIHGRIETFIGRSKYNRQKMSAEVASGKDAITNYKTLEIFKGNTIPDISLIECKLETGRTHQIRVHLSHKKSYFRRSDVRKQNEKNKKYRSRITNDN